MKLALGTSFIALLATLSIATSSSSSSKTTTTSSPERDAVAECYDAEEEQHIADLIGSTCDYNIFMCCWTENDGEGMEDNTDVCRYTDSSHATRDYPGDSEGEVHCHGFGWPEDADYVSFIEPLYHYVRNFDHRDYRGYFGSVGGAPECGCIEDMPVVSRADCSTFSNNGIKGCNGNLRRYYNNNLGAFNGPLSFNLVQTCDNVNGPIYSDTDTSTGYGDITASMSVEDATSLTENEGATSVDMSPAVPEYDEDEALAALLDDSCDYNLFMCCWTQNDDEGMEDNTDVCRYTDSSYAGRDYPGDSEGDVHCHGFGWPEGADYLTEIVSLYHFVRRFDHRNQRGYFGSIEGAPECGCIEHMPVVSRADCTTFSRDGLTACNGNDLRKHYRGRMKSPGGALDFNLVDTCDNANAPVTTDYSYTAERQVEDTYDEDDAVQAVLDECEYNTYMCCWTENDGEGMQDNTDVCRVIDEFGEIIEYPGESEGDVHCHGFGWKDSDDFLTNKLPLYHYVVNFDHGDTRGYYGNIPGAPQCGCIEHMPVVSRADCTTFNRDGLTACTQNDLFIHYRGRLNKPNGAMDVNLVKTCSNADETTSANEGTTPSPTYLIEPTPSSSNFSAGDGGGM